MAKSELILFPTPVLAAKGAICFTCFKAAAKLNRCGSCKRVSYCSQECQKKDWKKGHKSLCQVLAKVNTLDSQQGPQTWEEYRAQMWTRIDAFRDHLPRFSSNHERILQYQPYCTTCHRNIIQIPREAKLNLCSVCHIAATCTLCPDTHSPLCSSLASVSLAETFAISHYLETGEPTLEMPTQKPRGTYKPLSSASSWYDYYTEISDKTMLKGLLSPDLKPLAENTEMACAMTMATDKSSLILTIIAGLEAVFPDLGNRKTVHLHIIGATAKELDSLMLFEEMLHLLPSLQELHCSFIGIEMPRPVDEGKIELDCCPDCTQARRIRSMSMWKGAYHDYVRSESYVKPDMGVAFHTGFSQEARDDWWPTIQILAVAKHPTMFTTFNKKEMEEETALLGEMGAELLVKGEKNLWRGMRPMLEVLEEEEGSVYFNNQHWYIVAGKGTGQ